MRLTFICDKCTYLRKDHYPGDVQGWYCAVLDGFPPVTKGTFRKRNLTKEPSLERCQRWEEQTGLPVPPRKIARVCRGCPRLDVHEKDDKLMMCRLPEWDVDRRHVLGLGSYRSAAELELQPLSRHCQRWMENLVLSQKEAQER